jgi:MFS family permease
MLLVFTWLLLTELFINYDSGAVAASLNAISEEMHLGPSQQGFLGGLTYIGVTVATPFAGYFLQRYSATKLLRVMLLCKAIFTFIFAMAPGWKMLLISRAFIGAAQSAVASYGPVWVDEYAPKGKKTLWMSLMQGSAIVGVMVGYSLAGFTQTAGWSWRFSILIQACVLTVLALILFCVPKKLVDLQQQPTDSTAEGGATEASQIVITDQLRLLWRSPIYVYTTLAIAALFFVVTGIQFWITSYMTVTMDASFSLVLGSFTAISATAPVLGLLLGGWLVDRQGGYHGREGRARTAQLCTYFGLAAAVMNVILVFVRSISGTMVCVWLVLFWGGAMLPGSTGLLLSSVPQNLRAFSAAMSMFVYNIGGYGAGEIFPGICMQLAKGRGYNQKATMQIGLDVVFLWSLFGVLWMYLASVMARKEVEEAADIQAKKEVGSIDSQKPASQRLVVEGRAASSI